jgi:hypothetical protein
VPPEAEIADQASLLLVTDLVTISPETGENHATQLNPLETRTAVEQRQ